MDYVCYFTKDGAPAEGLSPSIDVFLKVADGSSAGTPPDVTELGGGFYKFSYTATEGVVIRVDSNDASMSDAERYLVFTASPHDDALRFLSILAPTLMVHGAHVFYPSRPLFNLALQQAEKVISELTGVDRVLGEGLLRYFRQHYSFGPRRRPRPRPRPRPIRPVRRTRRRPPLRIIGFGH